MNNQTCPRCDQTSADGLLCRRCQRDAHRALIRIAQHWPDVYRRRGSSGVGSTGGGYRGSVPINDTQAKTIAYVRNQLATWAIELDMGDLGRYGEDTMLVALWLASRTARLVSHEAGSEAVDEFDYCADLIRREIDVPIERFPCAPCPTCGGDVYAFGDDEAGLCKRCDESGVVSVVPKLARRTDLTDRLETEPMPRRLLMEALPLLGIRVKPATIRQWRHRGRLLPADSEHGADLYRISDVRALLAEDDAKSA